MSKVSISHIWQSAKLREKFIIVIGLIYILLPFDIVPEIILGPLGLLDDGGALVAVIYTIIEVIRRQKDPRGTIIEGEEV